MPNDPWCHRLVIALLPRQALRVHILSAMTRDISPQGGASRRAFLGLGAFGIAATAAGCTTGGDSTSAASGATPRDSSRSRLLSENSRPGDPHWAIRHLGAANAIMGYAGAVVDTNSGNDWPVTTLAAPSGLGGTAVTAPGRSGSPARCAGAGRAHRA